MKCDAIKIAYRQSKDGFVVSFAIHPNEMPADLANADIGSQWQLKLVPLDEHGNAEVTGEAPEPSTFAADSTSSAPESRRGEPVSIPTEAARPATARSWTQLSLANQAGIRCDEPAFWKFLSESYRQQVGTVTSKDSAKLAIYSICGVSSRADLRLGTEPGRMWRSLDAEFRTWMNVPEFA